MAADDLAPPVPRLLAVMWGLEQSVRRGPKPTLTLEQIAGAGVAIADADGLASVSMSRVAKQLGFTTMSLYRYVNSKDELELAMLDHAYGPAFTPWPTRAPDGGDVPGWRSRLHAWAYAVRSALLRHPWILDVSLSEPPLGPHQVHWMEVGLAALAGTPLTGQAKLSSLLLVDVYTRGQTQLALNLTGGTGRPPPQATPDDEGTERGVAAAPPDLYGQRLAFLTDDENFPHLRATLAEGSLDDDDGDFGDEEFAFGLRTVLDGIQANIDRTAGQAGLAGLALGRGQSPEGQRGTGGL